MIVNTNEIWYPRLIMRKDYARIGVIGDSTESLLMYNGKVNTMNMIEYHSSCFLKQGKFPFDSQTCDVLVGLTTTPDSLVRLLPRLTKDYRLSIVNDWKLLDVTIQPFKLKCANFEVDHSEATSVEWVTSPVIGDPRCMYTIDIRISISLQREWVAYIYSVIGPSAFLGIIAAAIFWLPPDCGEKLSFGVSLLLGFVVFQTLVQGALPEGGNGEPPAALSFIVITFFLCGCSVLLTAVTLTLHNWEVPKEKKKKEKVFCVNLGSTSSQEENNYDLGRDGDALEDEISKETVATNWKRIAHRLDMLGFVLYVGGFFVNIIIFVMSAT
ncbi:acetylcholine receptor subunit beta-like [Asterias rubens]|uniref:acetylcholine receptor subunit beta-like n=1 Tax=Asterias rubens TaxID=7604 RepID=UPI0014555961|nr:acetylcholine receptor subunit beta-like [Asterias rubens]